MLIVIIYLLGSCQGILIGNKHLVPCSFLAKELIFCFTMYFSMVWAILF